MTRNAHLHTHTLTNKTLLTNTRFMYLFPNTLNIVKVTDICQNSRLVLGLALQTGRLI